MSKEWRNTIIYLAILLALLGLGLAAVFGAFDTAEGAGAALPQQSPTPAITRGPTPTPIGWPTATPDENFLPIIIDGENNPQGVTREPIDQSNTPAPTLEPELTPETGGIPVPPNPP